MSSIHKKAPYKKRARRNFEKAVKMNNPNADIVHLYKNKGDSKCCDNHRGISLLCIAGKIFARLQLNRLRSKWSENVFVPIIMALNDFWIANSMVPVSRSSCLTLTLKSPFSISAKGEK